VNIETSARRRWTAIIGGFFLAQAALWTFAITTVSSDPSHAVVADYDARALDWDAQRARAPVGWHATLELDRSQALVRIVDAAGEPVQADHLALAMFHKAEAAHRQAVTLHAVAPGVWAGPVTIRRSGLWQLELTADAFNTITTVPVE
jgi:nitrogen fixation protein FixH